MTEHNGDNAANHDNGNGKDINGGLGDGLNGTSQTRSQIVDSQQHREWAEKQVTELVSIKKKETLTTCAICLFLMLTAFFGVFIVSSEGIDVIRVWRIFSNPNEVFSQSDEKISQNAANITNVIFNESENIATLNTQLKFLNLIHQQLTEAHKSLQATGNIDEKLRVIDSF